MLKENGKTKKIKYIKCDGCRERFELCDEDIVRIDKLSYIECPSCGLQHVLKK